MTTRLAAPLTTVVLALGLMQPGFTSPDDPAGAPPPPPAPAASAAPATPAAPAADDAALFPRNYYASVIIVGGPVGAGTERMKLILQRFSTVEERQAMLDALRSGGQDALIAQMEKYEVGRLSIGGSLGWPVSLASVRETPTGRMIRIGIDRPIQWQEYQRMMRSADYPIGFLEFSIPSEPKKYGSGVLVLASRVKVDETGSIVVESLPGNTAPQRLENIREELPKAKKKK